MRFSKKDNFFRCIWETGSKSCFLGLAFSGNTEKRPMSILVHHFKTGNPILTTPEQVRQDVLEALTEKEAEYQRLFTIETVEYFDNDYIPDGRIYYEFTQRIIDRMMNFPEYEGRD